MTILVGMYYRSTSQTSHIDCSSRLSMIFFLSSSSSSSPSFSLTNQSRNLDSGQPNVTCECFFLNYPSKSLLMRAPQRMYQLCGFVRWAAITRNGSERECTVCVPALLSLALGVSSTLLFLLPCSKVEKWHRNSRLLLA